MKSRHTRMLTVPRISTGTIVGAPVLAESAGLTGANASRQDVDQPWEQDNQAWWEWYASLGTRYDRRVDQALREEPDVVQIESGPFAAGDVSFNHNLCFHSAASNRSRFSRMALATTYSSDGACVVDRPTMVSGDWQKFMPGVAPGQLVDSHLNPVCWWRHGSPASDPT